MATLLQSGRRGWHGESNVVHASHHGHVISEKMTGLWCSSCACPACEAREDYRERVKLADAQKWQLVQEKQDLNEATTLAKKRRQLRSFSVGEAVRVSAGGLTKTIAGQTCLPPCLPWCQPLAKQARIWAEAGSYGTITKINLELCLLEVSVPSQRCRATSRWYWLRSAVAYISGAATVFSAGVEQVAKV
eukprot:TRINITY_DN66150_c0_g1_i1.p1 TRINITY_DN66150_c0_g1~~TRINITY_DN66150_c0_g1_i1.p1  ORF type:complete len:190 (-),score=46.41 TRINITY_DN66150_c0_g1_i1:242-811(-)